MPSEVADVMLPNAQSTPWPKEDARETWGALPVRPALAAVLGALTTEPEAWWREKIAAASRRDAVRVWSDSVDVFVPRPSGRPGTTHQRLWSFDDPDAASEVLLARGLLPAGWCGDVRRGWWCAACEGAGLGLSSWIRSVALAATRSSAADEGKGPARDTDAGPSGDDRGQ